MSKTMGRPPKLCGYRSKEERDYEIYHAKFSAAMSVKEIMERYKLGQHTVYMIIKGQTEKQKP